MNPWDLVPWVCSIGVSLVILLIPSMLFIYGIQIARGKE